MSKIDYVDETWNPWVGCQKGSKGCRNCYAEKMARRLQAMGLPQYQNIVNANGWSGKINLADSQIKKPFKWRKPRRVFVCSMSDFFQEGAKEYWDTAFEVFGLNPEHTFIIITKRPKNMKIFIDSLIYQDYFKGNWRGEGDATTFFPNVWLGITAEDQETFDFRWEFLKTVPAAKYVISHEPALGGIWYPDDFLSLGNRAWVIVGGESGYNARPCHPDWVRQDRDQCKEHSIPFFFKQWGEWFPRDQWEYTPELILYHDNDSHWQFYNDYEDACKIGKKSGYLLDGEEYREIPTGYHIDATVEKDDMRAYCEAFVEIWVNDLAKKGKKLIPVIQQGDYTYTMVFGLADINATKKDVVASNNIKEGLSIDSDNLYVKKALYKSLWTPVIARSDASMLKIEAFKLEWRKNK